MRFDDNEYLERYRQFGEFPRIHDDIAYISRNLKGMNVIDLGCCTGLLSLRLAARNNFVVGIEANKRYLDQCINKKNVEYINLKVCEETLHRIGDVIEEHGIQAIYARRVLPELYDTGGLELVRHFVETCYVHGVSYFVVEGRKSSSNAVNALSSIDEEMKAFDGLYSVIEKFKQCRILNRI